jgi:hypothetical protein
LRVTKSVVAALALIALATLTPGGAGERTPSNCLICGGRGLADAILNVMLFMPLGAALVSQRARWIFVCLAGCACSLGIEVLQFYIPGRDPSASDLVFNTIGTAVGTVAPYLFRRWQSVSRLSARRLAAIWAVIGVLITMAAGALLRPALPKMVYYGQWTPEFGNTEQYRGRVVSADIGDLHVRNAPIRRSEELRSRLLRGDVLHLKVQAGPTLQWNSPVFNIYDARQHEVLSVMAEGRDIDISYRMYARRFRLDAPTFLMRGALREVAANSPWSLQVRLIDGGICARTGATTSCPLGFSPARGWALLISTTLPRGVEVMLDMLWLALLFMPAGSFIIRRGDVLMPLMICLVGLLAASALAHLQPLQWYELLAATIGLSVGSMLRARFTSPVYRHRRPSSLRDP